MWLAEDGMHRGRGLARCEALGTHNRLSLALDESSGGA